MQERAYAVDILRGLAIVGMVFSGYIAWNPDLPSWLFHAQVPPPRFAFDASVAGITWVDLVFPFFLFSMGAAFPLSLGRKIERGTPGRKIAGSILKRGLLLAFFAIVLGNAGLWRLDEALHRPLLCALLTIVLWGAFFALFVRLPNLSQHRNRVLNACGLAVVLLLLGLYRHFGVDVSIRHSDIIILILANVVVAGSFLWWLTRRNRWLRLGIVALIVALKLGAAVPGSWNEAVWNFSPAPWLFRIEYLQYLCIVLPGSLAGEIIAAWLAERKLAAQRPTRSDRSSQSSIMTDLPSPQARSQSARPTAQPAVQSDPALQSAPSASSAASALSAASVEPLSTPVPETAPACEERPARLFAAAGIVALLVSVNLWGLFVREQTVNLLLTLALGGVAAWLLRRPRTATERLLATLFSTGFFWLLLGLACESLEGGIKKDPATVSYFFVTAGMASHVLLVTSVLLEFARLRGGLLLRCGQNPLVAYTAAGYVVVPLLLFVDRAVALPWMWGASGCVMSVVRSVVVTLAAMLLTAAFTRRKLFWRT